MDPSVIRMLLSAMDNSSEVHDYPFVGHLAHLLFLDDRQRPLALISVVLHDCTVTIQPCIKSGRDFAVPFSASLSNSRVIKSDQLVRYVYQHLEVHASEYLHSLQQEYEQRGIDIKAELFQSAKKGQKRVSPHIASWMK